MYDAEAQRLPGNFSCRRDAVKRRANDGRIAQRFAQPDILCELGRKGHSIAVEPQHEGHGHGNRGPVTAERGRDRQRSDHVCRVGVAIEQPVAHRRPGHVAHQFDGHAFTRGKSQLVREDRQRRVDERQETDTECLGAHSISPKSASLVTIASAISAIRRLVRIA